MSSYVPNTQACQKEMLKECGYKNFEEMFSCIPSEIKLDGGLNLPEGLSEMEVMRKLQQISQKNKVFRTIFRGAGAYNHYIPSIVKSVCSKEEFVTAYTPYQAEISQGILQSIFEFQTMICELTGMDVANASHYDGATAAAEAIPMCVDSKHRTAYVSETVNPGVLEVMKTYCFGSNTKLVVVPAKDGVTDMDSLKALLQEDDQPACFYLQQPNYFGIFEESKALGNMIHNAGGKFIMGVNPIALSIMETPEEAGADIAVGDGQPLGMPIAYGGPYFGFMATTSKMMRKLPGRIVGETTDAEGNRAFVLTLQAREQHIRREKASSNICSNENLCTLIASVYMAAMGSKGIRQAAVQSMSKAHYMKDELEKAGFKMVYTKEFFNEFVTDCPVNLNSLMSKLSDAGILGGMPLGEDKILWCTTEMNSKEEIDEVVAAASQLTKCLNSGEVK